LNWAHYPSIQIADGRIPLSGGDGSYIAYLYFNEFKIQENMYHEAAYIPKIPEANRYVTLITNNFLENMKDEKCKGLIFDLRGNPGGDMDDIPMLLAPLVDQKFVVGRQHYKKSAARLDYSQWGTISISSDLLPEERRAAGEIPIVALVNDYSVSCGEIMPLTIREMPKGYLIGTRTFGAMGNIFSTSRFHIAWGDYQEWNIRKADIQTKGKNLESYEGTGLEPDFTVPFSRKAFTNNGAYDAGGVDAQLEAAIKHIDPGSLFP
jgi:C-terminal processing protease CtpA/Prc